MTIPRALQAAGAFILNESLLDAFEREELDLEEIHRLLDEAEETDVTLDAVGLGHALAQTIERGLRGLGNYAESIHSLQTLLDWVTTASRMPFEVDLTTARAIGYLRLRDAYPACRDRANH